MRKTLFAGLLLAVAAGLAGCGAPAASPTSVPAVVTEIAVTPKEPAATLAAAVMPTESPATAAVTPEAKPPAEMPAVTDTPAAVQGDQAPEDIIELQLELTGLGDLGPGWAYEGWLVVDGTPLSTGTFTIDAEGMPGTTRFELPAGNLAQPAAFVLTIEPAPDSDPAPSAVHVLAGDIVNGTASLSPTHPAALGNDLGQAGGSYILGIPTSSAASDSYRNGIWWTELKLPTLPAGWIYEGWVVGAGGPLTTGRFATIEAADSDDAGPTAGPKAGPAIPGQDYLQPPIDLTSGYAAVVTIEPEPDNSPAPFVLKLLVDESIADAGDHVPQAIANVAQAFPRGSARLSLP